MVQSIDRAKIPNVVVIGGTGAGKSSVAIQLAKVLGFGLKDIDCDVESQSGMNIADIVAQSGIEGFREREWQALTLIDGILNHVIVLGAGAVEHPELLAKIKRWGPMVWIRTPTCEVVQRLGMNPDELRRRPLLREAVQFEDRDQRFEFLHQKIDELLNQRLEFYNQAEITILNSYATAEVSAMVIKNKLQEWGAVNQS